MSAPAVAVRERPILFSAPMVRALHDGRKTQTRRVVKGTALEWLAPGMFSPAYVALPENHLCPYGAPGDRLWVRETWGWNVTGGGPIDDDPPSRELVYRASRPHALGVDAWKPSIHMPRAFSRLTLEVTGVRVERLQEISIDDVLAEGVERDDDEANGGQYWREQTGARYAALWDSLNKARGYGWDLNPWVWVVEFTREGR